ncbi:hypothetical protein BJX99DRAFT_254759 [Aspergillus californicus]
MSLAFSVFFSPSPLLISPSASPLHPLCIPSASPLHPLCIPSASPLHPLCIPSVFPLHPLCIPSASPLHPLCIPSASPLHPLCIPLSIPLSISPSASRSLRLALYPALYPALHLSLSISISPSPLTIYPFQYQHPNCHLQMESIEAAKRKVIRDEINLVYRVLRVLCTAHIPGLAGVIFEQYNERHYGLTTDRLTVLKLQVDELLGEDNLSSEPDQHLALICLNALVVTEPDSFEVRDRCVFDVTTGVQVEFTRILSVGFNTHLPFKACLGCVTDLSSLQGGEGPEQFPQLTPLTKPWFSLPVKSAVDQLVTFVWLCSIYNQAPDQGNVPPQRKSRQLAALNAEKMRPYAVREQDLAPGASICLNKQQKKTVRIGFSYFQDHVDDPEDWRKFLGL